LLRRAQALQDAIAAALRVMIHALEEFINPVVHGRVG